MDRITDENQREFIGQVAEGADAWVRGDLDRYLDLVHHAPGFTLLAPDGGPVSQHEDRAAELSGWTSTFADGEATLEQVATHSWGDTIVVSMIERQHGRVGDQPDQNLSTRVTHVYRREGSTWLLVHRHADPLVVKLTLEELGGLLRR